MTHPCLCPETELHNFVIIVVWCTVRPRQWENSYYLLFPLAQQATSTATCSSYYVLQNLLHQSWIIYEALAQKYLLIWQGFLVVELRFFSSSSWIRQMVWFRVATERAKAILGPCEQSLHTRAQEQSCSPPAVTFNSCLCLKSTDQMMENAAKNKHQAITGMTSAEAGHLDLMAW